MEPKDFKYNAEEPVYTQPTDILCIGCKNKLPDIGKIEGYNKDTCDAYEDRKPIPVLLGRSMECPKYVEE